MGKIPRAAKSKKINHSLKNRLGQQRRPISRRKLKPALALKMELGIPIEVGIRFLAKPEQIRALRRSPENIQLLKAIGNQRRIALSGCEGILKLGALMFRDSRDQNLYSMCDLKFLIFPSSQERKIQGKELEVLDKVGPFEEPEPFKLGAFGEIEIGIVHWNGQRVALLTNGQARKAFWQIKNNLRNTRYKQWYDKSIAILREALAQIGITKFVIPSNEVVNETLQSSFGHTAPDNILDQFYDGYANKRQYTQQAMTLTQPRNGKKISGNFWTK